MGYLVLKVVFAEVPGLGGSPVSVRQSALHGETRGDSVIIKGYRLALPSKCSSAARRILRLS